MGGHFEINKKQQRIKELEENLMSQNDWSNIEKSNDVNNELINLKKTIDKFYSLNNKVDESISLCELLSPSDILEIKELENELINLKNEINDLEVEALFKDKYDNSNCFLEIHPGAGGTEACDWAEMLQRMYIMFCEKYDFKYEILDKQKGETAGIKSVTIKISKMYAYGYFKGETGVHRLVRISPFNAAGKRQTSFASVSVIPEIDNNIKIDIKDEDLRIDVYRSSGCGGQGVNTTDSAVRITHIPTGIVVTCQNERSQIKNKAVALNVLKSKLYQLEEKNKKEAISDLKGTIKNIDFGSQIRNYTLEPYSLIKDVRTGYETANVEKVLNGDIIDFMKAYLRIKR